MSKSIFSDIPAASDDEPFVFTAWHNADAFEKKVNLSIGAYRDENGKSWVLPVVRKVEIDMANDPQLSHEYLPILGHTNFLAATQDLLFNKPDEDLRSRIVSMQTISGTGACHVGARLLTDLLKPSAVWISNPTWNNHHVIWSLVGNVEQKLYPYYDETARGINFTKMMTVLEDEAQPGEVIILHACAHNPTGLDLNTAQWTQLADLCKRKQLVPFFDAAYQGFASGDPDKDAWAIRYFLHRGFELCVAQAFSKNMGLYGERVGALHVVCATSEQQSFVAGQLSHYQRGEISTPPTHGAAVVSRILRDESLRTEWIENLGRMTSRIEDMRLALYAELQRLETPGNWEHILRQIGMFSYTGLTKEQVSILRERFHIFMLSSGRISIPGLNHHNLGYVASSIDKVVRETECQAIDTDMKLIEKVVIHEVEIENVDITTICS